MMASVYSVGSSTGSNLFTFIHPCASPYPTNSQSLLSPSTGFVALIPLI
ncbi:hypothetical protein [Proteus vulgaris]|nr:hypothetical protein [Proteus vulgaris]